MSFTIRTIYLTFEDGSSTNVSTDPMDAIKFIVKKTSIDIYGAMTVLDSGLTELRKGLGVFYYDNLMRIVETKEEGEELSMAIMEHCTQ